MLILCGYCCYFIVRCVSGIEVVGPCILLIHSTHIHTFTLMNFYQATPEGQLVFDKLLKACNEVVWKGESIIVLKEIRVDPPYKPDNCSLIKGGSGGLDAHSLERVKKIVSTVAVP